MCFLSEAAAYIANEVEKGLRIKADAEMLVVRAKAEGRDPKHVIPHPDDIVVTKGKGRDITGPADPEELTATLARTVDRDLLVGQAMLEERLAAKLEWLQAVSDT